MSSAAFQTNGGPQGPQTGGGPSGLHVAALGALLPPGGAPRPPLPAGLEDLRPALLHALRAAVSHTIGFVLDHTRQLAPAAQPRRVFVSRAGLLAFGDARTPPVYLVAAILEDRFRNAPRRASNHRAVALRTLAEPGWDADRTAGGRSPWIELAEDQLFDDINRRLLALLYGAPAGMPAGLLDAAGVPAPICPTALHFLGELTRACAPWVVADLKREARGLAARDRVVRYAQAHPCPAELDLLFADEAGRALVELDQCALREQMAAVAADTFGRPDGHVWHGDGAAGAAHCATCALPLLAGGARRIVLGTRRMARPPLDAGEDAHALADAAYDDAAVFPVLIELAAAPPAAAAQRFARPTVLSRKRVTAPRPNHRRFVAALQAAAAAE